MEHYRYGLNPLLLREKVGVGGSLLIVWCYINGEVFDECFSGFPTNFNVGIFWVIWCIVVTKLVSGFHSKGIAPCVAVYSVHLHDERNLEAFYVDILVDCSAILVQVCWRQIFLLSFFFFWKCLYFVFPIDNYVTIIPLI